MQNFNLIAMQQINLLAVQGASLDLLSITLAFQAFLLPMVVLHSRHCDIIMLILLGAAAQSVWWTFKIQRKDTDSAGSDHAGSADLKLVRHDSSHMYTMHAQDKGELRQHQATAHTTVSVNKSASRLSRKCGEKMQRPSKISMEDAANSRRWASYAASHYPKRAASHSPKIKSVQSSCNFSQKFSAQATREDGRHMLQVIIPRGQPVIVLR